MSATRPRIGLTVGDPAGIGPELVRAVLEHEGLRRSMRLLVFGPERLRPPTLPAVHADAEIAGLDCAWRATPDHGPWELGRVQESAGRHALSALEEGARCAAAGLVDALVTGPVSKEGLHLAGAQVEGQTELLGRWAGVEAQMLGCADRLRVYLLTRHLPLAEALRRIEALGVEGVVRALRELHEGLTELGFDRPKLALAGLNPHAGENGLLGDDEERFLGPAVDRARAMGVDVDGPVSPDTVFVRAARGTYDAVLALYHDQAFIPLKLHAPERAFTVLFGLPYLRLSPAHGTAFDIAGQGIARPDSLFAALERAADWAEARRARSSSAPG